MITLQFQRSPFHPIKRTVNVPWNEIVVIQTPIIMAAGSDYELNHYYHLTGRSGSSSSVLGTSSSSSDVLHPSFNPGSSDPSLLPDLSYPGYLSFRMVHSNRNRSSSATKSHGEDSSDSCYDPNFTRIKPLNRSKPSSGTSSGTTSGTSSGTTSGTTSGTGSIVHLQLIDSSSSQMSRSGSPILIHVRIIVEGNLFSTILEAEPALQLTHSWNRRNVYRQKVYGSTIAKSKF